MVVLKRKLEVNNSKEREMDLRVLIIRLSSIGDVILTTPILKKLKKKYPQMTIDFVVLKRFKDSIEGVPYIDNLILFDKKKYKGIKGIKSFVTTIKDNEYEYIFDLHAKLRSFVMCFFLKGKVYRYKKRALWKTILVKLKLIKYNVDNTIVKNYFNAFKDFDIKYSGEDLTFSFSQEDLEVVRDYSNYIVFAPGASKETKKWTVEGFGNLAKLLHEKYNKSIILIGGNGDKERCEKIDKISGGICIDLAGKLSLKESGALLSNADFLVTNDSGPFHMARGVKTKSFVIFGPTDPNMFEYDDLGILVYRGEECSPCSLHGDKVCPKGHFNCMKKLKSEDVLKVIEEG